MSGGTNTEGFSVTGVGGFKLSKGPNGPGARKLGMLAEDSGSGFPKIWGNNRVNMMVHILIHIVWKPNQNTVTILISCFNY